MRWFGESWGAPVNDETEHIDTPVDNLCWYCDRLIDEDDQGFELLRMTDEGPFVMIVHRDCLLRVILPEGYMRGLTPPV